MCVWNCCSCFTQPGSLSSAGGPAVPCRARTSSRSVVTIAEALETKPAALSEFRITGECLASLHPTGKAQVEKDLPEWTWVSCFHFQVWREHQTKTPSPFNKIKKKKVYKFINKSWKLLFFQGTKALENIMCIHHVDYTKDSKIRNWKVAFL